MRFGLAPCRHLIGLPLLHSGHSLINASVRGANVTRPIYAKSGDFETTEIDVTHKLGTRLSASDAALLRKYQDALQIAIYWPDVEHFRACVAAYDAMIARPE
jgi:hypothetical protein